MRADKPIGTTLLLWPTLSSFFILTAGNPDLFLMSLFVLVTFFMRSAGCVINDYFDRNFDGKVTRTKNRPLVIGEISEKEALILFYFLLLLSSSLLLWMNYLTFLMALIGLMLAIIYPLTKRFFSIPQIFLGLAFSWGIIMVSTAELNEVTEISLLLFASCFFWIMAYDTAYALCDKEDDLGIGINSSAILFGENVRFFFYAFHIISLSVLILVSYMLNFHFSFYIFALISLLLALYQGFLIKDQDHLK